MESCAVRLADRSPAIACSIPLAWGVGSNRWLRLASRRVAQTRRAVPRLPPSVQPWVMGGGRRSPAGWRLDRFIPYVNNNRWGTARKMPTRCLRDGPAPSRRGIALGNRRRPSATYAAVAGGGASPSAAPWASCVRPACQCNYPARASVARWRRALLPGNRAVPLF